jgi:hypothetical protein
MNTGLHAISSGLQRFAIILGLALIAAIMAYATLIFVIVAVQAVSTFGQ